ncbi:hypothetical protein DEU56DRAFT_237172 [Suillus clintonianus]|uniref:uncharacterized protein n=1 Tax=Suillus clintonianus TaxID=1904413 RepID=UPI001B88373C|nr:uncharacterized protein DEU56DRAFT_237172 [Suillus clintonianus]KAG2144275.1 hypothetical protein DEU56DRAFT_237172 [Suillus clintonianus]
MSPSLSPQFVEALWVRKSFSAAGHTLLVYDYFLTLQDEILYIWHAPWTVVKVLFLLNRYGNLIGQTYIRLEEAGLLAHSSMAFCQSFTYFTTCFVFLSTESIHILVLMRAWAIWGTPKRVSTILIWSYVSYVLILIATSLHRINTIHLSFPHLNVTQICVGSFPKYVWLMYFGSLILDTVLFVLTMRSLRRYSREFQQLYPSNLLHMLFRDAIMLFLTSVFNNALIIASLTAYPHNPKHFLGKGFSTPLLSVAGQRLVLNLRGLKTRTYTTFDLGREVDRQLEAFADTNSLSPPGRDALGDPEGCCSTSKYLKRRLNVVHLLAHFWLSRFLCIPFLHTWASRVFIHRMIVRNDACIFPSWFTIRISFSMVSLNHSERLMY